MATLQKKIQNDEFSEDIDEDVIFNESEVDEDAQIRFKKNDKAIKAEKKKLLKILSKIDENLIKICDSLLENIAFMSVTLDDLIKTIKLQGVKEVYKNGKNQFGFKESVESQSYNKYMKSYQSSMKLLIDMLTKDESSNDNEVEKLKEYFARGRK
ncbi:MAG: hypothetical protein LUE64_06030 [Candidatus Gastranaerophilales bacterium]|nr:hypothetical protein [Candidatus Gastranaerophilales bacterium]